MIKASLILNIAVLIPVCLALIVDNGNVQNWAGVFTPARGVLLAMYLTILLGSILLLFYSDPKLVFALLFVQIVYKFLSPFTVGTLNNPIVISNLFIAGFHVITIYTMWASGKVMFDKVP